MTLSMFEYVKYSQEGADKLQRVRDRFRRIEAMINEKNEDLTDAIKEEIEVQSKELAGKIYLNRSLTSLNGILTAPDHDEALLNLLEAYWWAGRAIWDDEAYRIFKERVEVVIK